MSLQRKIVVLFLALGAVFAAGSYAGLSAFIFPTFEEFERLSAEESMSRVRKALDAELRSLEVVNREYSEWDHTHQFALGKRDSYIEENLDIAYWTNIDINAMFFFDLDGEMLWGAIVDETVTNILDVDDELYQPLTDSHMLVDASNPTGTTGIVQTRTAPLLVASLPILLSTGEGDPAGTAIIGRFLGPDFVQELGERAGVQASLVGIDSPGMPAAVLENLLGDRPEREPVAWSYAGDLAIGHQLVLDVFGNPAFVLRIETPRTITAIGRSTIATALAFFIAATGLFLLMGWLFTRSLITAPVGALTRHIKTIRESGNLDQSLQSSRTDEIGELEQEFGSLSKSLRVAQQDLEAARDKALAISNAKSDFLAKMSHEIRTPMNGVIGMIELLAATPLDKAQKRYMHSISQSAESLLDIISDILDFSKMEAGKLTLETRAFNLNSFVLDISDSLSGLADRKGLRLNTIFAEDLPINVEGDSARLRQVLTNLLGNAIKFTEEGRVLLKVSTVPDLGEYEYVTFQVIDTGIGISQRKQQHVFKSFAQEDGSTTRRYGGTGLGLSISKQLVEMMGGKIDLVSEPGSGSTFSFTLRLRADRSGDMTGIEKTFTHEFGKLDGNLSSLKPLQGRVLVAEDNAVNQAVAVGMLDAMGVESVIAADGKEAVSFVKSQSFDAILMDCQMPVMDGFQAAERIRQTETANKKDPIRIIAVTANAMAGDMEKCIAAGMDDYLRKPYKAEQLNAALAKVLQPGTPESISQKEPESPVRLSEFLTEDQADAIDDAVLQSLSALPHAMDHDLINQVIQTYINTSMDLMTRLGEAIDREDSECIRSTAHSLRSSSANVGAVKLAELCASIEMSTRKSDRATAVTLQRQIKDEYARVLDAMRQRLVAAA
jgi:signal transduction histidine kinase/CheY-like chemotaxis protein/HPt (histidine-containing phosphotransfer) domain-containing protein